MDGTDGCFLLVYFCFACIFLTWYIYIPFVIHPFFVLGGFGFDLISMGLGFEQSTAMATATEARHDKARSVLRARFFRFLCIHIFFFLPFFASLLFLLLCSGCGIG